MLRAGPIGSNLAQDGIGSLRCVAVLSEFFGIMLHYERSPTSVLLSRAWSDKDGQVKGTLLPVPDKATKVRVVRVPGLYVFNTPKLVPVCRKSMEWSFFHKRLNTTA